MKITSIQNNTNFKSGLTPEILALEQKINPKRTESYFKYNHYNDWLDFQRLDLKNNKAYAAACKLCFNIFKEFKNKHNYVKGVSAQNHVFPHDIYVYNYEDLTEQAKKDNSFFLVNWDYLHDFDKKIRSFDPGTILMRNNFPDLESIDAQMDKNKKDHFLSTGHFLHHFVHEWLHSIQQKIVHNLTSDLGQGSYGQTVENYQTAKLSRSERNMVYDILGKYAAQELNRGEYAEVFAEGWAKCILEALDKDCIHFKKDPLMILKTLRKEFQTLLWKVSDVEIARFRFGWSVRNNEDNKPVINI